VKSPYLSIVIPVYNSEKSLEELVNRITHFCKEEGVSFEIIAINDCSKDQSYQVLQDLSNKNPNLKAINLSKNFGQQAATLCGLLNSSGEYIVTIDDDLEYNPEDIHTLLFAIEKTNIQLIYGYAEKKERSGIIQKIVKLAKYGVYGICGLSAKLSSFRILRKDCLSELTVNNSYHFIVDGLLKAKIKPNTYIAVGQNHRKYGQSNYNFVRLVKIWFQFLFSASIFGEFSSIVLLAVNVWFLLEGKLVGALLVILLALILIFLTFKIKWRQKESFEIKEKVGF
jgi:glycosyltransferase involved in cell wall biosynthesis